MLDPDHMKMLSDLSETIGLIAGLRDRDVIVKGDLVTATLVRGFTRPTSILHDERITNRKFLSDATEEHVIVTGHCVTSDVRRITRKIFLYEITTISSSGKKILVSPSEIKFVSARDSSAQEERREELAKMIDERLSGIGIGRFKSLLQKKLNSMKFEETSQSKYDDDFIDSLAEITSSLERDK